VVVDHCDGDVPAVLLAFGDHAGGDVDDALQDQKAPALAVPCCLDA